jgi:hypothetical protein
MSPMTPSVANYDHLGEDVGTAPSEKNDYDSEEDDRRDTSDEEQSALSLGSTASSNNTTNQICKMLPQGKFKGKELLYKNQVEEQQERDQEQEKNKNKKNQKRLLPTAKKKGANFASRVNAQYLYYDVFTMIPHHLIPDDFDALTANVKNILTSLSNKRMPILTPTDKLNVEVAS